MDNNPPPYYEEDSDHQITLEGSITEFNQQIPVTLKISNLESSFKGYGMIGENRVTCRGRLLDIKFEMIVELYGLEYDYKGRYDARLKTIKGDFGMKESITDREKFTFIVIHGL